MTREAYQAVGPDLWPLVGMASGAIAPTADAHGDSVGDQLSDDLYRRMSFAQDVEEMLLPYLRYLPEFAGAYFDRTRDSVLVVALTDATTATEEAILRRAPSSGRVEFASATSTYDALLKAFDEVRVVWPRYTESAIYSVAVDERSNEIVVSTPANTTDSVSLEDVLTAALGVSVRVVQEEPGNEASCTRSSCYNPMEAGVRIGTWELPPDLDYNCTMGFHVFNQVTGDRQFVTAGHCGYGPNGYVNLASNWYMNGYGKIRLFGTSGSRW